MPRYSFAQFPPVRGSLWIRTIVMAVSAVLLLGGCQSGSTPSETSTTTAPPTAGSSAPGSSSPGTPAPGTEGASAAGTPSPSGAYKPADATGKARNVPVPVMPALAKENTKEGLEAFIRYWYAQLSYVDETGDMSGWLPLFAQECRLCLRLQESGEDGYVKGRWLAGGQITVPVIEVQWQASKDTQWSKVQVIQQAINYYNADGSVGRARDEASNDAFALIARFTVSGWTVTDLGLLT
ncbi:DUF6318 family protein [Paenarthrobacter sp. NPDC018779]|uniref:DUF6318 family protein n=1 Tax=Paenarthrobacter sp. NPDC018779 TaxID=3364375 RepID=UPI0037C59F32